MKGRGSMSYGAVTLVLALLVLFAPSASADPKLDTTNSISFFTNLASRLLKAEMNLDLHHLQIHPTNQYTPAVHRLLQVTANLYDTINPTNDAFGPLPTVFRPRFKTEGNTVFIEGYEEVVSFNSAELSPQPLDLSFSNGVTYVKSNSLIFGIPFVIGARKGLPNLNEFASESIVQITRKLELRKTGPGGGNLITQTNHFFTIGISNAFGTEFWNSYPSNYTRPVQIAAINWCLLELTNDFGFVHRSNLTASGQVFFPSGATNEWPRWNASNNKDASLLVSLRSNHIVIPDLVCAQNGLRLIGRSETDTTVSSVPLPFPRWGLTITNRVVAYIRDRNTGRLLDYVQLNGMVVHRELVGEMAQEKNAQGFAGLWATNAAPGGVHLSDRIGVINQIQISKGDIPSEPNEWQYYGFNQPAGLTKDQEIANFRAFFMPDNRATYNGRVGINTNTTTAAPFTPTWKQSMPMLWQANDPLIHYMTWDMEFPEASGLTGPWNPPSKTNSSSLNNLGRVNERYRPWGGNPFTAGGNVADPHAYNHAFKDPLVRSPNTWDFPEGEPLSLALLRRVHRGTPWQTIYLKSSAITNESAWRSWTGNRNPWDAEQTLPTRDWNIATLIWPFINTNHPRALLSVNERDTNAWLAALDGIVALTNSVTDEMLENLMTHFDPITLTSNSPQAALLAGSIQTFRDTRPNQRFNDLDELLAVAVLTHASPFLNHGVMNEFGHNPHHELSLNDEAYERIPVQLLTRLRPDSLGSIVRDAGGWRIRFTGFDEIPYAVEKSTNLTDWQPVATNLPVNGCFEMPLPIEAEKNFFRSVLLP